MSIGNWLKKRNDKLLTLLLEKLDDQTTELLAFHETAAKYGVIGSSVEHDADTRMFLRDLKVMIAMGREDHAAGKILPREDEKHLLTLHAMLKRWQADIAHGKRLAKKMWG